MNWAFFVPPLIVAELYIRARRGEGSAVGRLGAAAALTISAAFVGYSTFFFTLYGWGPAIAMRFGGGA